MEKAAERLRNMTAQVGMARQVKAYDSDRRKNLLAHYIVQNLKEKKGVAVSEALARSDTTYQEKLDELATQLGDAESLVCRWNAAQAEFEAARSLLSFSKATMDIL